MTFSTEPPPGGSGGSGCWASGRPARPDSRAPAPRRAAPTCNTTCPISATTISSARPSPSSGTTSISPSAIVAYDVHRDFGGDPALARLRQRMHRRQLGLLVDFVPNHVALDHPWVDAHPEFLIAGNEDDLRREPKNYIALQTARGRRIFAHGRDPNFFGWNDTLQLNYRHGGLREAMITELERIAERAGGGPCQ